MAKKAIQKHEPSTPAVSEAPDFIKRGHDREGFDRVSEFVSPPLLKIIQRQSSDDLLERYGKASVVLMPSEVFIASADEPFFFIPLLMYPEWVTWSPYELKDQLPTILDRTLDPNSELAAKAKDRNRWFERDYHHGDRIIGDSARDNDDPWGKPVRHVEHLTFIIALANPAYGYVPCIMSFSKGSYRIGRNFCNLIAFRNADLYGCIFKAYVDSTPVPNPKGSYHALRIENPGPEDEYGPWVTDEPTYDKLAELAMSMSSAYAENRLRATYDSEEVEEVAETRNDI